MSDKIIHLIDNSLDTDVLGVGRAVLADFWTEWCSPYKMIALILDEITDGYQDKPTVAELNIDQNPGTAPEYGIRGILTLLLSKSGEVTAAKVGALSESQLRESLDANLTQGNFVLECPVAKNWTPGASYASLVLTSYWTYLTKFESYNLQRFPFYLKCEVNRSLARYPVRLVVPVLCVLL